MEQKVYLAGKIYKNDWRTKLDMNQEGKQEFSYEKIGPGFVACDHGCFHGQSSHGRGLPGRVCYDDLLVKREDVIKDCLQQIRDADVIYCWIESEDIFGTLFELGYAKAHQKPVFICIDDKLRGKPFCRDIWFACYASAHVITAKSAKAGWEMFMLWYPSHMDGSNFVRIESEYFKDMASYFTLSDMRSKKVTRMRRNKAARTE